MYCKKGASYCKPIEFDVLIFIVSKHNKGNCFIYVVGNQGMAVFIKAGEKTVMNFAICKNRRKTEMKKCKKLLAFTLSVLLAFACYAVPVFAVSSANQYGLEATIVTDKESYKANEEIHVTVTVKNTNDFKVEAVSIESLLPETLTLKDGSNSTKTVDLEPGETLTLSFTAVKEKEETSATEPESQSTEPTETEPVIPSESQTVKPSESESVKPSETETAKPTESETVKPSETETQKPSQESTEQPTQAPTTPITTEPTAPATTTEGTTLAPSTTGTQPTTGGIVGDLATTFPKTTTPADSSTTAQAENPDTGDSMSVKTLAIAIIALFSMIAIVIILMYKYKKQTTKMISLVMCVAISASAITGVTFFTAKGADDGRKSFTVEKVITVDGEETNVSAEVKYQKQTEAKLGLVIDQKDFTTTEYKQTITGYFDPNKNVVSVSYSIMADIDEGEVSKTGIAILSGNKWKIKDIELKGDRNVISVTARDKTGAIETKQVNVTFDMGDSYRTNPDAVRTDEETGIRYVHNVIVATCRNDITEEEKKKVPELIDGKIVGRFNLTDTIYIEIKPSSLSEIEELCELLEQSPDVMSAHSIRMIKINDLSVTFDDPWEIKNLDHKESETLLNPPDTWNSTQIPPKGTNWGLLATHVHDAWQECIRFSQIDIGIVDSGFDTDHADLKGTIKFPNEKYKNENNVKSKNKKGEEYINSHGTGVAGIIGANANNGEGITGILWGNSMFCVDWTPNVTVTTEEADRTIYEGIEAVVNAGAKVINLSVGNGETYAPDEEEEMERDMRHYGETTAELIAKLLSEGKDFLLVAGAGNSGRDARENPYFTNVTEKTAKEAAEKYKVPIQDILDRIIVVGAVSYEGYSEERGYKMCDSSDFSWGSNWGDRIDICAPGSHLLSTAVDDKYQHFDGTSSAAPIVSGIAGMVWSVNKDFTASEVKEILLSKTQPAYRANDTRTYKMVDARLAVNEAIRRADANGNVQGRFIDSKTKEPLQAEFVVREEASNGKLHSKQNYITDTDGNFSVSLPAGHFVLEVHVEDYITNYIDIHSKANSQVNLGDVQINKEPGVIPPTDPDPTPGIDDNFAGGDGSKENPYQIATAAQLNAVRNHMDSHFVLINDIDLSKYNWEPIGEKRILKDDELDLSVAFKGSFNGQGHKIKNLTILSSGQDDNYNSERAIGLFGFAVNANIENTNLVDCRINIGDKMGQYIVGGICGDAGTQQYYWSSNWFNRDEIINNSIVRNCMVEGNIKVSSEGCILAGGIIGAGSVTGSTNKANIEIKSGCSTKCGGVAGKITPYNFLVKDCINYGFLKNIGEDYEVISGGISGENGSFINCINCGEVKSIGRDGGTAYNPHTYAAGIVGVENVAGKSEEINIKECINYKNIEAVSEWYGYYSHCSYNSAGGILGEGHINELNNSVNYGNIRAGYKETSSYVESLDFVGGISANYSVEKLMNCYNMGNISNSRGVYAPSPLDGMGRIFGGFVTSDENASNYSLNTTTLNGSIPTEDIGPDQKNGGSMTKAEIEKAIQELGFELPGELPVAS